MPNLPGSPIRVDLHILALLSRLHAQSLEQEESIDLNVVSAIKTQFARDPNGAFLSLDALMLDKFIALEEDKCQFMYNLLLSSGGTIVVEAGTSFGVSTIYLSLAVGQNVATQKASGDQHATGRVIGTEKEPSKADIARAYWAEAGEQVEQYIDLKVGDLNDTLAGDLGLEGRKVDFLLLDSKCSLSSCVTFWLGSSNRHLRPEVN